MTKLAEGVPPGPVTSFGNGLFAAIGDEGSILTSPDGITWTARDTGVYVPYDTVSFCNNEFVALGGGGTISISLDGVHWTNSRSSYQAIFTVGRSNYILNGQTNPTDAAPYIDDNSGRVLVPARFLAYALGVNADWDANTRTVTMYERNPKEYTTVSMAIGSAILTVNGHTQTMDQSPVLRDGRTYLPARYVAEALGYNVSWDAGSQTVTVSREE
jgi:hypothetical protein